VTSAASDHDISVAEADTASFVEAPASQGFELGVQIFMLVLSVIILVNSLSLGLTVPLGPGAGFFPFFLSIGLGILTVAWFVQSWRARSSSHGETVETSATEFDGGVGRSAEDVVTERKHIVNIMVSLVVLAVLMIPLGFQIPMFAFIVYHLWFRAQRRWYTVLTIAVAGSVGVFHVFNDLLSVALPYSSLLFLNTIGM
jgi:hypothetical protein